MRKIHTLFATVAVALLLIGCGTTRLQPGGAYAPVGTNGVAMVAPDYQFFVVDSAYRVAHGAIDLVFTYELENEIAMWQISPRIKYELDKIRPTAVQANAEYHKARNAYMIHPTPANLSVLQTVAAKMQQLSAVAQAIIPKPR